MKTLKKINLLVTVIGFTTFVIGNILQLINMSGAEENGTKVVGLNELTYWGSILLTLSLITWCLIMDYHVFTDWNRWIKTKTKADDVVALGMFTVVMPISLSLTSFVLYDLIRWYDWYTWDNFEPLYQGIGSSLRGIETEMPFWIIFITIISISSGLAIFLYKAKVKKQ